MKHLQSIRCIVLASLILSFISTLYGILDQAALKRMIESGSGPIKLSTLLDREKAQLQSAMPDPMALVMDVVELKDAVIKTNPGPLTPPGYTLSGTIPFFGTEIALNFYNSTQEGGLLPHVSLELATRTFKFSNLSSSLSFLDAIKFGALRLIIATEPYTDPTTQMPIKAINLLDVTTPLGINVLTSIGIETDFLAYIKQAIEKLGPKFRAGGDFSKLNCAIFIPHSIMGAYMKIGLPLRVGVDFNELYEQKKIRWQPRIISSIALKDIMLTAQFTEIMLNTGQQEEKTKQDKARIKQGAEQAKEAGKTSAQIAQEKQRIASEIEATPTPTGTKLIAQTGIVIGLVNQASPLVLSATATFRPSKFGIRGTLSGMYKQAFGIPWLDLGNFVIGLDCDFATAAVTLAAGSPFTGIELGGALRLGSGADESIIQMSGRASINLTEMPEFHMSGSASQLPFTALLKFLSSAVLSYGQQITFSSSLPDIRLTDVELTLGLTSKEKRIKSESEKEGEEEERVEKLVDEKLEKLAQEGKAIPFKEHEAKRQEFKQEAKQEVEAQLANAPTKKIVTDLTRGEVSLSSKEVAKGDKKVTQETLLSLAQGLVIKGGVDVGGFKGSIGLEVNIPDIPGMLKSPIFKDRWKLTKGVMLVNLLQQFRITASGNLDPIVTRFLKFTSMHNPKVGPHFEIAAIVTEGAWMNGTGMLEIPFLGLRAGAAFSADSRGIFGTIQTGTFFNTKIRTAEFLLPFSNVGDFSLSYQMTADTLQQIKKTLKDKLSSWKDSVGTVFENRRKELERQIRQKELEMVTINSQREYYSKECEKRAQSSVFSTDYWKAVGSCVTTKLKDAQAQYHTVNNQVKQLRGSLLTVIEKVPKGLIDTSGHLVDIATAIEITKVYGVISAKDIMAAKMPSLTVECTLNAFGKREVRTLNMQFDFAHPIDSSQAIATQMITFIFPSFGS